MAKLEVIDHTGHTTIEFDKLDPAQKRAMQDKIAEVLDKGGVAATRKAGQKDYKVIRDPAQASDETLLSPQYRGG